MYEKGYEGNFATEEAVMVEKALQPKDRALALSCFAQRRINMLKQSYKILGDFLDSHEYSTRCVMSWITCGALNPQR